MSIVSKRGHLFAVLLLLLCNGCFISDMAAFLSIQEVRAIDEKCFLVVGGGGNSAVFVGDSAVVVVDTKMNAPAQELFGMVKKAAQKANGQLTIIVVNTHIHGDHVKGNYLYTGSRIIAGKVDKDLWIETNSAENLPTEWLHDSLRLHIGNETLLVVNTGQAHTFADVVVYAERRKMLIAGDIVQDKIFPTLFPKSGCKALQYAPILEKLLARFDIQSVLPGHGKIGTKSQIEEFLRYFRDMERASVLATSDATRNEIVRKYDDWRGIPFMSGTDNTMKRMNVERDEIRTLQR